MPPSDDNIALDADPLWYKDAIIYEVPVRAFRDSSGNGWGDFGGLTERLDYLHDLGVTAIWVLPFYPSPLKDDGYDIADYTDIHSNLGALRDFEVFLQEAHRRKIRVITELVLNHTSDQHAWFQRARRAPAGSPERDFYVWTDAPDKYQESRIIFKDFETSNWAWDPTAKAYYWHRFYTHQPDLNFDNPEVLRAILPVVDFWLQKGVDGMRLDAVPYLYEREGTSCENLPETHEFLRALRRHIDERFAGRMFLAEANQWPEDAIAYFGQGDECHMAFHFPLMPRMFMAISTEDRFPIVDILSQTPAIPDNCQWALFLRNHDELTLEMVTDEERDYMYRAYAKDPQARINLGIRRRLAPLLGNNRRRIELMNALLFSLPGTPVLYYGDEIGMGDNIYLGDRNGVRTPMQWSSDRNAGFSRANSQRLYSPVIVDPEYHFEAINVEAQQNNPHSLLWWTKRLIALRKQFKAFGRGTLEILYPENHKILAFVRRYQEETILVVANLSRFVQHFQLKLKQYEGLIPIELFGRVEFPAIGTEPYFLMLGPHAFCWFSLMPRKATAAEPITVEPALPGLAVRGGWDRLFRAPHRGRLEELVPSYLKKCRWFGGKARPIRAVAIEETIPLDATPAPPMLTLMRVEYTDGDPEWYAMPLAVAAGETAAAVQARSPQSLLARLTGELDGVLYDALGEPAVSTALLEAIAGNHKIAGALGEVVPTNYPGLDDARGPKDAPLKVSVSTGEQSNSSVLFGRRMIMKFFRRVEPGVNPELEMTRFLTQARSFPHVPPVLGALEYRKGRGEPMTLAVLQAYVHNEGSGWKFALDALSSYCERALAKQAEVQEVPVPGGTFVDLADQEPPPLALDVIGSYLESARLLGQRTAQMHQLLASEHEDPRFVPEAFTTQYQRALYQSMRGLTGRVFRVLHRQAELLPEPARNEAAALAEQHGEIIKRFRTLIERRIHGVLLRVHGDYHLGQVLYTGKDFMIIDFEGEPLYPLRERHRKRSPLRDVAGMLRSFSYAAHAAVLDLATDAKRARGSIRPEDRAKLEPWLRFWYRWVSATFLRAYLAVAGEAKLLPPTRIERSILLEALVLEKAIYELGYELQHRPDWVGVPIRGIHEVLSRGPGQVAGT